MEDNFLFIIYCIQYLSIAANKPLITLIPVHLLCIYAFSHVLILDPVISARALSHKHKHTHTDTHCMCMRSLSFSKQDRANSRLNELHTHTHTEHSHDLSGGSNKCPFLRPSHHIKALDHRSNGSL